MDASVSRQYPEVANVHWEYTHRTVERSGLHEMMNGMGQNAWEAWHMEVDPPLDDQLPCYLTVHFKRRYVMVGGEADPTA